MRSGRDYGGDEECQEAGENARGRGKLDRGDMPPSTAGFGHRRYQESSATPDNLDPTGYRHDSGSGEVLGREIEPSISAVGGIQDGLDLAQDDELSSQDAIP